MENKYIVLVYRDGIWTGWRKQTTDREPWQFNTREEALKHIKRLIENGYVSPKEVLLTKVEPLEVKVVVE